MATRRNIYIAQQLGVDPDRLQWLLNNAPTPLPLPPLNWHPTNTLPQEWRTGVFAPAPIAYAGPAHELGSGGYTYGAPIAAREDFT